MCVCYLWWSSTSNGRHTTISYIACTIRTAADSCAHCVSMMQINEFRPCVLSYYDGNKHRAPDFAKVGSVWSTATPDLLLPISRALCSNDRNNYYCQPHVYLEIKKASYYLQTAGRRATTKWHLLLHGLPLCYLYYLYRLLSASPSGNHNHIVYMNKTERHPLHPTAPSAPNSALLSILAGRSVTAFVRQHTSLLQFIVYYAWTTQRASGKHTLAGQFPFQPQGTREE